MPDLKREPPPINNMTAAVREFVDRQPAYHKRRRFLHFLLRSLMSIFYRFEVTGTQNIPGEGPAMLMMNHINYIDPIACTIAVRKRYVISMAKAETLRNPIVALGMRLWGQFIIRRGEVDRKALLYSIELMKSGQLVLMAPEGTRHPDGLREPKDGMAYIAAKANPIIIPAIIAGAEEWNTLFKKFRRARVRVHFGRPFRFRTDNRNRIPREELKIMMREAMYQLALAIPEDSAHLRGAYSDIENATTQYIEFVNPQTNPVEPLVRSPIPG